MYRALQSQLSRGWPCEGRKAFRFCSSGNTLQLKHRDGEVHTTDYLNGRPYPELLLYKWANSKQMRVSSGYVWTPVIEGDILRIEVDSAFSYELKRVGD